MHGWRCSHEFHDTIILEVGKFAKLQMQLRDIKEAEEVLKSLETAKNGMEKTYKALDLVFNHA